MRFYVATLWLLGAVIPVLVLVAAPPKMVVCFVIATAVIQTSHQLSPIVLAWSNEGFRKVMLDRPTQYLGLPVLAFVLAVVLPFQWVLSIYGIWNAYHYGMQNFGVLSIWRKPKQRRLTIVVCLFVASGVMLPTFYGYQSGYWLFLFAAAMSFNHWIVDIGLSSRAVRWQWLFVGGVLLLGFISFIWFEPTIHGFHRRSDELLKIAMAIGFVHFLYSRWVWKLSDKRVRETIGANLFRRRDGMMRVERREELAVN